MIYIFYNPKANNERGLAGAQMVEALFEGETFEYHDITEIDDFYEYIKAIDPEAKIVLAGGDGTLNVFVNKLDDRKLDREILYFPAGSGNDFWKDISNCGPVNTVVLNPYVEKLPYVRINGKKQYFLNGVGFGLDGYCCEEADRQRAKNKQKTNYTAIAIKGLLYAFKARKAKVTVDGKLLGEFDNVLLCPVMNGRYYGGGMMVAPMQDRLNKDRTVSCLIMHCKSRLKALILFPKIFSGKLAEYKDVACCFTAKRITVEYNIPCAAQVDGETILNLSKCEYYAYGSEE